MTHYLIEFRLFGKAKYDAKNLIWTIAKRFRLGWVASHRPVPHITLAGPFSTGEEDRLIRDFSDLCKGYGVMKYKIDGFDTFDQSRVVFLKVHPDSHLKQFRKELAKRLASYCNLSIYDNEEDFKFHSTIAMKIPHHKFALIKDYIRNFRSPYHEHLLLRVTLIKNSMILKEYDFMLKKTLSRFEAKNQNILERSFEIMMNYKGESPLPNDTNSQEYLEVHREISINDFPHIDIEEYSNQGIRKVFNLFKKPKVFIISDLHLDHTNIIKYCRRPFSNVHEMNETLVHNWNSAVGKNDIVLFLGDLAYGRSSRGCDYWIKQLNGRIIFLRGNHDNPRHTSIYEKLRITYLGVDFLLVHDPKEIPTDWKGWSICGHTHNNKMEEFPLVNPDKKTINASCELLDYAPLELSEIISKLRMSPSKTIN